MPADVTVTILVFLPGSKIFLKSPCRPANAIQISNRLFTTFGCYSFVYNLLFRISAILARLPNNETSPLFTLQACLNLPNSCSHNMFSIFPVICPH